MEDIEAWQADRLKAAETVLARTVPPKVELDETLMDHLKAYEAVANHRFNFTTLSAEPHVWGAPESGRGTVDRRLNHFAKASIWLDEHFGRQLVVRGPTAASSRRTRAGRHVDARVVAGRSERLTLPDASLDAVVTDPPYHDDVHYSELSDLFRAWAEWRTGRIPGDAIVRRAMGNTDGTAAYQAPTPARVHRDFPGVATRGPPGAQLRKPEPGCLDRTVQRPARG
jgi:hypothetical protein